MNQESQFELACANCGHRLDPTDKFCRECGLPTPRYAQAQKLAAVPPDTSELKRAFAVEPELKPFARPESETETELLSTSDVVRATNPTFAAKLASSTLLMVAVMVMMAVAGIVLLILAFRP